MRTKLECMRLVAAGLVTEIFSHATMGQFDITRLRQAIGLLVDSGKMKRHRCDFNDVRSEEPSNDPTAWLFSQREIDIDRANELTAAQLDEPLLFLLCPPGTNGDGETHLLVDGIHRMYARRQRKMTYFEFYLLPLQYAPRVDSRATREIKWGEKDLVPGVGLVARRTL